MNFLAWVTVGRIKDGRKGKGKLLVSSCRFRFSDIEAIVSSRMLSSRATTRMLFGLPVPVPSSELVRGNAPGIAGLKDWREFVRTTAGVAARELAREGAVVSPYMVSRNICADMTCASLGSEAATVAWREVVVEGSRIFEDMERNRTSRASCVNPRCVRDPRIVWLCDISAKA